MQKISVEMIPTDMAGISPEHRALTESANAYLSDTPIEVTSYDDADSADRTIAFDFEHAYRVDPMFPVNFAEMRQQKLKKTLVIPERPDDYLKEQVDSGLLTGGTRPSWRVRRATRRLLNALWKSDMDEIREAAAGQVDIGRYFMTWSRQASVVAENDNGEQLAISLEQVAADGIIRVQGRQYSFARTDIATSLSVNAIHGQFDRIFHVTSASPMVRTSIYDRHGPAPILPGLTQPKSNGLTPVELIRVIDALPSHQPVQQQPVAPRP